MCFVLALVAPDPGEVPTHDRDLTNEGNSPQNRDMGPEVTLVVIVPVVDHLLNTEKQEEDIKRKSRGDHIKKKRNL